MLTFKNLKNLPKIKGFSLTSITCSVIHPRDETGMLLDTILGVFTHDHEEVRILMQSPAKFIIKREKSFKNFRTEKINGKLTYLSYDPKIPLFPYKGKKITWVDGEFIFTMSLETKSSDKEKKNLVRQILTTKSRVNPKKYKFIRKLPKVEGCELSFISSSIISPDVIQTVGTYHTNGMDIVLHLYEGRNISEIYDQVIERIKSKKADKKLITGLIEDNFYLIHISKQKDMMAYAYVNKKFKTKADRILYKILQKAIEKSR
jgi:hypothetical protein